MAARQAAQDKFFADLEAGIAAAERAAASTTANFAPPPIEEIIVTGKRITGGSSSGSTSAADREREAFMQRMLELQEQYRQQQQIIAETDVAIARMYKDVTASLDDEAMPEFMTAFDEWATGAQIAVQSLSDGLADTLVDSISGAGASFKRFAADFLRQIAKMIAQQAIFNAISGAVGGTSWGKMLGFAGGGAFQNGQVTAFAGGGIVGGPTMFPMRGGRTGLMGERGPEAIMPLARTSDGKLGVKTEGGNGIGRLVIENHGSAVSAHVLTRDDETRIVLEAAQMGSRMSESATERSIRSGYGGLSRGLQSTYGLRRRG
jgi:hypothetical protein